MVNITTAFTDTAAGRVAFGSVGAGYGTLLSCSGSVRKLIITNSLNQEVVISLDNGTTDFIYLPANVGIILDFDNSVHFSGVVQVKHNGVAPTSGAIAAGIIKGN